MNDIMTAEEIKDISTMIKRMIIDYVDLDGRVFISNHNSDTSRLEIVRHFNVVHYDCVKFVKKYEAILPNKDINKCIEYVTRFIDNAKYLMIDLFDDDLDNSQVMTRAIKRGFTTDEF